MKNMITYTQPKLRPMPTTVTNEGIRDATLPVKIEAARRAIANCTDLPELLRYQDQAQGLAAAVKVMKTVAPEMVSQANKMCKEAIIRMGELLLKYNGAPAALEKGSGKGKSERAKAIDEHGIKPYLAQYATRIGQSPTSIKQRIINDDSISPNADKMVRLTAPRVRAQRIYSDTLKSIMGNGDWGLTRAAISLKKVPMDAFHQLSADERKIAKAKLTELVEILDEMDRLCR